MMYWQPIETAPKDGRLVWLCWMEDAKITNDVCLMRWIDDQTNGLFPGKVGMWVADGVVFTWNDDGDGGPTHWAMVSS